MADLVVVSFGGGVQSTALMLMTEAGVIPGARPDVAFFADTRWEPSTVYDTIRAVTDRVSFPVEVVGEHDLAQDVWEGRTRSGHRFVPIPVFIRNLDGKTGMNVRQCTSNYKIDPINRAIRARLGLTRGQRAPAGASVEQWMGISIDEAARMKPNRIPWITNRFPLVEGDISRQTCLQWLQENHPDVPVGKSACVGCPYHSAETWRQIARDHPEEFARAVEIDRRLRTPGHNRMGGDVYLHSSRMPLDEALAMAVNTPSLFDAECEGMCGV